MNRNDGRDGQVALHCLQEGAFLLSPLREDTLDYFALGKGLPSPKG